MITGSFEPVYFSFGAGKNQMHGDGESPCLSPSSHNDVGVKSEVNMENPSPWRCQKISKYRVCGIKSIVSYK